jgi:hypothetical protein
MKKGTRNILILTAVLVVLIAGYLVLRAVNVHTAEKNAQAEADAVVHVGDIQSPSEISLTNTYGTETFYLKDGVWYWSGSDRFPLSQEKLTAIADAVTDMTALRALTDAGELEEYGLDVPTAELAVTDTDGSVLHLAVGGENGSYVYVQDVDSGTVYVVESSFSTTLDYSLDDMLELETFPDIAALEIDEITLSVDGNMLAFVKKTVDDELTQESEDVWYILEEGDTRLRVSNLTVSDEAAAQISVSDDMTAAETYMNTILGTITNLEYIDCVDYDADTADLATYGLETPSVVLTVSYTADDQSGTFTLNIGTMTDSGEYYAAFDGGYIVSTVSTETVTALTNAYVALSEAAANQ